jgi:hypothetical protein
MNGRINIVKGSTFIGQTQKIERVKDNQKMNIYRGIKNP